MTSKRVLHGRLNRMPQEIVGRPGEIGDLRDKLWLNPVDARKNERRAERVLRGGGTLRGDDLRLSALGRAADRRDPLRKAEAK
jgi:hypothetical protein